MKCYQFSSCYKYFDTNLNFPRVFFLACVTKQNHGWILETEKPVEIKKLHILAIFYAFCDLTHILIQHNVL